jgi:meiosis induction protein kinase IME2/SME1
MNNARNRRSIPKNFYDTPEEEDELLDEALRSANRAARRLNQTKSNESTQPTRLPLNHLSSNPSLQAAYLTPSPSAKRNGVDFNPNMTTPTQPLNIQQGKQQEHAPPHWPTPPYEENEWASAAARSIYAAAGPSYR